ncbi:MAG TPA: [protein-PII] uridylyltransferase [Planctomycetaceae bacterium]|jgi:[protein-PII] uridylyltransferase|nr:[protein-PII] uridylyltransferase [Planctomycetaceae bacterium]
MSQPAPLTSEPATRLKEYRAEVEAVRTHARVLFDGGATGIQVAAAISEATEAFVIRLFDETVGRLPEDRRALVGKNVALIAVGGTGRGELCPYSDVDLLFLIRPAAKQAVGDCISQAVRDYWDAGLRLGHAVRGIADTLSLARQEIDVATALVEARLLWGDRGLFEQLFAEFQRKIIRSRVAAFIDDCVDAREEERAEFGSAVKQLEPDVKRSPGGLRDLHLLRWVGFARFGTASVDSLRLQGALSRDEARILLEAYDFLKHVRVDLHFAAGRCQDVLVRDDQLRIAEERHIEGTVAQRPVERFMQTYFRHSTAIAELSERFITLHRPRSIFDGLFRSLTTHRSDGIYLVANDGIDVVRRHREQVLSSLEEILKFYRTAALYQVAPSAEFAERIREAAPRMEGHLSSRSAELFREILNCHGNLGLILRSMFRTGILEIVVPPMAHARCLLQFNQYHSYTVDEHTLRTIEVLERFDRGAGLLGEAYRAVRKKYVLHLAMLLHDLGKGYDEDHALVGRAIADRMGDRLRLTDEDRETLVFLVHRHLAMAHQAFRRDNSEYEAILDFSREVGSAERLRMLFVLTAADVTAVGPGVWTQWKSQLVSELYGRTLVLLSGHDAAVDQALRLAKIKRQVMRIISKSGSPAQDPAEKQQLLALLEKLPAHYLSTTAPDRIAFDLRSMLQYRPGQIQVDGHFDPPTQTVEYRIITHENDVQGCFHKATGVLTAQRLEIASAQICTTPDGFVIDSFHVHDRDFAGAVPAQRIEEVASAMQDTLSGRVRVEELFQRHRRFGGGGKLQPLSNLPARVVVDNGSSERFTVIDVFSHDRPGLLYTLSRKIFELELSVVLAKIATHLDQVVDVFYVTARTGGKLEDPVRLKEIQSTLLATLDEFERHEWRRFAS